MLIRQIIDVEVFNNKDPIEVEVVEKGKGSIQNLKIEGNMLTITGGNTVQLPLIDTAAINTDLENMRQSVQALGELPHLSTADVQEMIDKIEIAPVDLKPIQNQIEVLNNRVDSTNKAINNLPVPLSEAEIQALINKSLPDLTPIQNDIQKKYNELFEEIDTTNSSFNIIKKIY